MSRDDTEQSWGGKSTVKDICMDAFEGASCRMSGYCESWKIWLQHFSKFILFPSLLAEGMIKQHIATISRGYFLVFFFLSLVTRSAVPVCSVRTLKECITCVCTALQLSCKLVLYIRQQLAKRKGCSYLKRVFLVQFNIFQFYRPDSLLSFPFSRQLHVQRE